MSESFRSSFAAKQAIWYGFAIDPGDWIAQSNGLRDSETSKA